MQPQILPSAPTLRQFQPVIKYQLEVLRLIRHEWNHRSGFPQILLSGSYGSAKSVLMAHIGVTHCLMNPKAVVCLARKGLPDLKKTILKEVLEHIQDDLKEGDDYVFNKSNSEITFSNGAQIICMSWSDKRYKKGRSLKLSGLIFEEIVENNDDDKEAFDTLVARLNRIQGVSENFVIAATNPDSPSHWVYEYWMRSDDPSRFVFYSLTEQNPFIAKSYIDQLRKNLTPREADRYLRGIWIELNVERIYYEYQRERNFRKEIYEVDDRYPIYVSWDFNIGENKPLSCVLIQYIADTIHIFDECVVEGMRTKDSCYEIAEAGLLDYDTKYYICGDAAGRHRDTRSNNSDYDIIEKFFANYQNKQGRELEFENIVPRSNPPLRDRHNLVNSYCNNDLGEVRLFVYNSAKNADKGLSLTQLKKGGHYIEDDSKSFQHITTAIGYCLNSILNDEIPTAKVRQY